MKLDANVLRYLSKDDFRVLTAVEQGQRNHEIVPCPLIESIAGLRSGGVKKILNLLLKNKLLHHETLKYDGFRLTNLGYDFLAIKTLVNRGAVGGMGRQIGVGKESDVFDVLTDDGDTLCLKVHRLGRTSFRDVKTKRDYLGHRKSFGSWLYLSRLAALKEFAFMKALYEHDFPVPRPVEVNRHAVLMEKVNAYPMTHVRKLKNPGVVYDALMEMIMRLASHGLIHGDFNEFNLMINDNEELTLIDFPQMISVKHKNAEEQFYRDVNCVKRFFARRYRYEPDSESDTAPRFEDIRLLGNADLDKELAASGFNSKHQEDFEEYLNESREGDELEDGDEDAQGDEGERDDDGEIDSSMDSFESGASEKQRDVRSTVTRQIQQTKVRSQREKAFKGSRNVSKYRNAGAKKGKKFQDTDDY